MNLLKLINIRTPKQIDALVEETELIKQRCDKIASQEFKEQKENQRTHDSRCPLCRAEKNEIVDKIKQVEGEGNVSGNLFGVMGRMKIETKPVNHCNVCGHEWFKFKTKYISKRDILRVALKYLNDLIDNPEHNKRLSWKLIEVF